MDERQKWRKAFEMIGPTSVRLQLETRRNEYGAEYTKEAHAWLREKEAEQGARETRRFQLLLFWTIVAGLGGAAGAIAASIAAWPVIAGWLGLPR